MQLVTRLGALLPVRQTATVERCSVCHASAVDGIVRDADGDITCLGCAILRSVGLEQWRPVTRVTSSPLPISA